jgi:hypothetical protein
MLACPSVYEHGEFFGTLADDTKRPSWIERIGTMEGLGKATPETLLFRVNTSSKETE